MINASFYKPRIFPILGNVAPAEIDRAQTIDPTVALNREKVEEIGRDDIVGYLKKSPTIGYRLIQLEYGSIEFWEKLTCSEGKGGVGESAIDLNDFKTPTFDICAYLTDDDETFRGTYWYPSLRTSGFSIAIGDPQARIERNFDFVGEESIIWQGANQYLIYDSKICGSGGDNEIDLSDSAIPTPAVDPDNAGVYILRAVRVTALGVSTELVDTEYSYDNGTKILTIDTVTTGDIIKYWYTSADAPDVQFTPNDNDVAGLTGECVSIYLYIPQSGKPSVSDYVYRLQSITLDVKFTREDQREIGNANIVQRGIKEKVVTVTIGRLLEQFTIEEVLRGEVAGFGKIDIKKFTDQASIIVKVYDDNTKTTFKYGFKATGLTPSDIKGTVAVANYVKADTTLIGNELNISADATVLGI